jgi:polysaccharide export outer membrane protein
MRSVSLRQTKELPRLALLMTLLGSAACASLPPADTAASSPSSAPAAPVAAGAPATPAATTGSIAGAPASGPVAASNDYLIGPEDLLKLDVFGVEALSKRSVRVNASGQISLPLIGVVQASGRTAEQLAADIAARLAQDYLQNPQVTIFIEEYTSQRVTVTGAVKTPNVFPLKGRTTLLQVVSQAGGPTSVASLGAVKVLRQEPGGARKVLKYDLAAIRAGEAPDPEIRGEDVVQVETSVAKDTAKQLTEFILPFWPLLVY